MARLPAGISRRKDGRLTKKITINGKQVSCYGHTVEEVLEDERRKRAGGYKDNARITLDEYFNEWIARKEREGEIKPVTAKRYKGRYKSHFSPVIGHKKIRDIQRRELKDIRDHLTDKKCKKVKERELSAQAKNNIMAIIHSVLKEAVTDGIIDKNPADGIKNLKVESTAGETIHRALSIDEQTRFFEEAKKSFYYNLLAFLVVTGFRIGEAGALTWGDIDFRNGRIFVDKTVTDNNKIGTPKTASSKRWIPMNDDMREILERQRAQRLQFEFPTKDTRVFQTVTGKLVSGNSVRGALKAIAERAEIDHIGFHALRHTFTTRFIEQRYDPKTAQELLGHKDMRITMNVYAHVTEDTKREAMNAMRNII